jgi:toxin-antitoxin system PIN domain toxin
VNLVDANVLLYAVNSSAPHHERSRRWLDGALSGGDTVAFAWIALLAFLRLSTKRELFPAPLTVEQAMDRVDAWLGAAPAVVVEPTPRHATIVRSLLSPHSRLSIGAASCRSTTTFRDSRTCGGNLRLPDPRRRCASSRDPGNGCRCSVLLLTCRHQVGRQKVLRRRHADLRFGTSPDLVLLFLAGGGDPEHVVADALEADVGNL